MEICRATSPPVASSPDIATSVIRVREDGCHPAAQVVANEVGSPSGCVRGRTSLLPGSRHALRIVLLSPDHSQQYTPPLGTRNYSASRALAAVPDPLEIDLRVPRPRARTSARIASGVWVVSLHAVLSVVRRCWDALGSAGMPERIIHNHSYGDSGLGRRVVSSGSSRKVTLRTFSS
jgi:hypothetical protein